MSSFAIFLFNLENFLHYRSSLCSQKFPPSSFFSLLSTIFSLSIPLFARNDFLLYRSSFFAQQFPPLPFFSCWSQSIVLNYILLYDSSIAVRSPSLAKNFFTLYISSFTDFLIALNNLLFNHSSFTLNNFLLYRSFHRSKMSSFAVFLLALKNFLHYRSSLCSQKFPPLAFFSSLATISSFTDLFFALNNFLLYHFSLAGHSPSFKTIYSFTILLLLCVVHRLLTISSLSTFPLLPFFSLCSTISSFTIPRFVQQFPPLTFISSLENILLSRFSLRSINFLHYRSSLCSQQFPLSILRSQ